VWRWVAAACLVVFLLPVVLYLGAVAYVSLGFLDATVEQKLKGVFGNGAKVGAVKTAWLGDLQVEKIRVEASDSGDPFTIASFTLDWDLPGLLYSNRIRSATIHAPRLALNQGHDGRWNFSLATSNESQGGYAIETINLSDGELDVHWFNAGRLHLRALNGSLRKTADQPERQFEISADLESARNISVKGSLGPGAAHQARLSGGIDFATDLSAMLGHALPLTGQADCEISSSREALVLDGARGGPLALSSTLHLRDFAWKLQPGRANGLSIVLPSRAIQLNGVLPLEFNGNTRLDVNDFALRIAGVGALSGSVVVPLQPGSPLLLKKTFGTIDFEALNSTFSPKLLGGDLDLKGVMDYAGVDWSIPLDASSPPLSICGRASSKAAQLTIKGFGPLPVCELDGLLDWPAFRDGHLKFGDIAQIDFELQTLNPGTPKYWLGFSNGAAINNISIDMGNILKSELGRRVLSGVFSETQQPPERGALPIDFEGRISAPNLKVNIELKPGDRAEISLSSLGLSGVSLKRWPLPFPVPGKIFSGMIRQITANLGGKDQSIELQGEVSALSEDKKERPLSTQFSTRILTDEKGRWRPGPVKVSSLSVPVPDLDRLFSISAATGLSGTGCIELKDAEFNPQTGDLQGALSLNSAALRLNLSKEMQSLLMEAGKLTEYGSILSAFDTCPVDNLCLSQLSTSQKLSLKDGLLRITGRVEPAQLGAKLPLLGEQGFMLPAIDLDFQINLRDAHRKGRLLLKVSSHSLEINFEESAPGIWACASKVSLARVPAGCLTLSTLIDLNAKTIGSSAGGKVSPLTLALADQKLPQLAALLAGAGAALPPGVTLGGDIKALKVEVQPFSFAPAAQREIPRVKISGRVEGVGIETPRHQFDGLTGDFFCDVNIADQGRSFTVNSRARLSSYEALLHNGFFLIPKAKPGHEADLSIKASGRRNANGTLGITLQQLDFSLGGYAELSAAGNLTAQPDGVLSQVVLDQLSLRLPDLAGARGIFGPANLDNRAPWFGDVAVAGETRFDGQFDWLAGKHLALSGKLGLKNAALSLGKNTALALRELNGELPLLLLSGAAPANFPSVVNGDLKIGGVAWSFVQSKNQTLGLAATPNQISLRVPVDFVAPSGRVRLERFSVSKLPGGEEGCELAFRLTPALDLNALLRSGGVVLNGMDDCVLSPQPLDCAIKRRADALGVSWHLQASGGLRAPFFGGEITVDKIHARGLFGPAPVFGCDVKIRGGEGVKVTQFTEKNQQLKINGRPLGKFSIRANLAATGITATSLSLAGLQTFTLDLDSVDYKDNEFFYDGSFAMALAYQRVREAFPKWFASDSDIAKYTFGVRELGLQMELKGGWLFGPRPKLPGGLVVRGYGAGKGVSALFSDRFKQDIPGDSAAKMRWLDVLKYMSGAAP
jgi:hypothetical protein